MGARFLPNAEPAETGHFIEFCNVSKAFDDHLVLDDVSFFVGHGETCVIMGRSGVGKSVTLKHILGFLRPDSGRVLVAGEDITDWSERQLADIRHRVTMVFQSGALFDSLTVAENIAFPLETRREFSEEQKDARVMELAEMLEVQPITLARLLDQLGEVGLIERRPDPKDRRAYHVYLTDAARPHLAAIERVAKGIHKVAMRDLTEKQAASALAALRKMRHNLASD